MKLFLLPFIFLYLIKDIQGETVSILFNNIGYPLNLIMVQETFLNYDLSGVGGENCKCDFAMISEFPKCMGFASCFSCSFAEIKQNKGHYAAALGMYEFNLFSSWGPQLRVQHCNMARSIDLQGIAKIVNEMVKVRNTLQSHRSTSM